MKFYSQFSYKRTGRQKLPLTRSVPDDLLHTDYRRNGISGGAEVSNQLLNVNIVGHLQRRQKPGLHRAQVDLGLKAKMGGGQGCCSSVASTMRQHLPDPRRKSALTCAMAAEPRTQATDSSRRRAISANRPANSSLAWRRSAASAWAAASCPCVSEKV